MGKHKALHPTDMHRKEERKKELKRNKQQRNQVKEVGEIKKDPEVALAKIKEIEAKERAHGPTERSTQRKTELQMLYNSLKKKEKREQEEKERQERLEAARAAKEQEARARQEEAERQRREQAGELPPPGAPGMRPPPP
eukprot:CAMPEP_0206266532 /NCGR_PEP_ID=MMETSP0047_2-20121206/30628_1 /ASSEMBLY_ACC=CAM_ASM_000192 /TAXON_ID=195065 /ORGANISM="Chroomonas mesostigmatica_cf, Strain CCMP1168" /LENGTH=138 /DNA_ID=CAMNT_0053694599 /DNA_START=53 /DNA_END=465 /DNA_ORIENTATION=+